MKTNWDSFIPKMEQLFRRFTESSDSSFKDERLEELYKKMQSDDYLKTKTEEQTRFDYKKAESNFLKIARPQKRIYPILRWVAVLLFPLSIAAGIYFFNATKLQNDIHQDGQTSFSPKHVYLLTSTQKSYNLSTDTLPSSMDIQIDIDNKSLQYIHVTENTGTATEDKPEMHTLVIPRGGEYSICLPDGTEVWLNSDSYLNYPVRFTGDTREVSICGEAYFKVIKQENKPFVVHTPKGSVSVWGTEFNIKAYTDEDNFITTLVTGSVSCKLPDGTDILLQPQEQLIYQKGQIPFIQKVDPTLACCWKDGLFIFQNKRMEEITQQISRWFDVKICYLDEMAKNLHFSGDLNKFEDIDTFITMFKECGNLNIWLENNTIYIKSI